ncbi:hypothetical protein ACSQ6I_11990 [Anabaena sp. WFMT]|uniref:hypothetical protein n=1 Tax=Anabaena sp. WFMT TaxID=3449730 RepID=UPI003F282A36
MNTKPYLTASITGMTVFFIQALPLQSGFTVPQPNQDANFVISSNSDSTRVAQTIEPTFRTSI